MSATHTYKEYAPTYVSTPRIDCISSQQVWERSKEYTGKTVVSSICIIRSYAISKHIYHLLNEEVRYFVFTRREVVSYCNIDCIVLTCTFIIFLLRKTISYKWFILSLERVRPYTVVRFVFFQFNRERYDLPFTCTPISVFQTYRYPHLIM